jgi:exosome complex exonuclease DIS3/RRP44
MEISGASLLVSEHLVRISYKKTRRNKVRKVLQEVYLRDDVPCGFSDCTLCASLPEFPQNGPRLEDVDLIVIPSSSVVRNQLDFLTEAFFARPDVCLLLAQTAIAGSEGRVAKKLKNPRIFPNEFVRGCYEEFAKIPVAFGEYVKRHIGESEISCSAEVVVLVETDEEKGVGGQGVAMATVDEFIGRYGEKDATLGMKKREVVKEKSGEEDGAKFGAHWTVEEARKALEEGRAVEGRLRVGMGGYGGGEVNGWKIEGRKNLNRAMEGDWVVVEALEKEEREVEDDEEEKEKGIVDGAVEMMERVAKNVDELEMKKGRIVCILERSLNEIVGSLRPVDEEIVKAGLADTIDRLFVPVDPRYPYMRFISARKNFGFLEGQRLLVGIDDWSRYESKPNCHYVEVFGPCGDRDTESKIILHMYNVSYAPFTEAVMRCLPPADYQASEEELSRRTDFRSKFVCSIDPPGCKDIDDALHCEVLPNGNWSVGVHIADVTHFVLPGSAIDQEAARRCTTVYLVERRTDMLPGLLTTDLCSLVSDKDRLTFSVLWEIDPVTANIVNVQFTKGVICSKASLTYQQAQDRIDNVSSDSSELTESIRRLNHIAKLLRGKRFAAGALELASNEVKFELDSETRDPVSMRAYEYKETNRLVEEFMLLANCAVGEKIVQSFPSVAVLRRHPPPKETELAKFAQLLAQHLPQFVFQYGSNRELGESLSSLASATTSDPQLSRLIRMMVTRCMNQAVYFASGTVDVGSYYHYGLAMSVYTHFTSPIRRYADVLVHRLLAAAIGLTPLPSGYEGKTKMQQQCDVINFKHRNAQFCGRKSAELHAFLYFRRLLALRDPAEGVEAVGTVVGVRSGGRLSVNVDAFGVEGVCELGDDWVVDEDKREVCKKDENTKLSVFDKIHVRIKTSEEDFRYRLVFEFIQRVDNLRENPKEIEKQRQKVEKEMFPDKIQRFEQQ